MQLLESTKQGFGELPDGVLLRTLLVTVKEVLDFPLLAKRLIFLEKLLTDDGSIYVHLDWRKVHYIKSLMDEVFGENNFIDKMAK